MPKLQVLDEYQKNFGDSWKTIQVDNAQPWPALNEALTKFQDPAEADTLLKIQRELDETKIILKSGNCCHGFFKNKLSFSYVYLIDLFGAPQNYR